jgi:hypothetical protein
MQIVIDVPDKYLLHSTPAELGQQLKLYTALLMFQFGQFSAGAACEFAGVDRYIFMATCKKHHISVMKIA